MQLQLVQDLMEPKPIVELPHFRHPTDEQFRHIDIYFLATKIICSLSTLNWVPDIKDFRFSAGVNIVEKGGMGKR